jgi:4-amino-4-deoxy-L-arabinose transferase-like glycosyltransferase
MGKVQGIFSKGSRTNNLVGRLLEERYQLPFLFVFVILVNLPFLGNRDLWAPVEPRYGEIARVMFERGEWIVPTVNGRVYTDKPILYFWLVVMSSYLPGAVSEWAVRLPSALAGCGVALVTYALGKTHLEPGTGFLAALIVASAPLVMWEARWAHTDMLFTLFFVCSLYFLLRIWLGEDHKKNVALAFAFMGLATLSKGLIGFVLPGLLFAFLVVWTRQWDRLRTLNLPLGIVVFLVVTVPWFLTVGLRTDGLWLKEFIWRHHIQRYIAGEGHEEGFYFYIVNFPLDFLPWTLILVLAVWSCWPERKALNRPVALFLAAWFAVVFFFFSLSNTKRGLYLLPLFPVASLFTARYVWGLEKGPALKARAFKIAAGFISVVFIVTGLAVPWIARQFSPAGTWTFLPLAVVMAASGWLLLRRTREGRFVSGMVLLACAMALSILCAHGSIIPVVNRYNSPRLFADEIKKHVGSADPLYMYRDTMNDFNFYLAREVIPTLSTPADVARLGAEKAGVYLLARDRQLIEHVVKNGPPWEVMTRTTISGKEWFLFRSNAGVRAADR